MPKPNIQSVTEKAFKDAAAEDKIGKFKEIFSILPVDEIEALLISFFRQDDWLQNKISVNREDYNWVPFLESVFHKGGGQYLTNFNHALSNIVTLILSMPKLNSTHEAILTQILDLVILLKGGLKDHLLQKIIKDDSLSKQLRESAGIAYALYLMDDNKKRFWEEIDYQKQPFLIYPLFIAFSSISYLELLQLLEKANSEPQSHNNLQTRIIEVLDKIETDIKNKPRIVRHLLSTISKLPPWLKNNLLETSSFLKFHYLGTLLRIFEKYSYKNNPVKSPFYFPQIPIYDLSLIRYAQETGIAKEFGLSFKLIDKTNDTYKYHDSESSNGTEMDLQNLLNPDFCKRNNLTKIKAGNLLLVMPRQVINSKNRKEGIDIAICNLFRHSFVINRSIDDLFKEDENFKISDLPTNGGIQNKRNFINTLFALWKKDYKLAAYDKKGVDAIAALFTYLGNHYGKHFGPRPALEQHTVNKQYLQQRHLEHLLDDPTAPACIVVCTAPVLAYALHRSHTYLFQIEDIKRQISNDKYAGEDDLLNMIDNSFIHTSLNINVPIEAYNESETIKKNVFRLHALIMTIAKDLNQNTESLVQFIAHDRLLNPLLDSTTRLSTDNIREAVNTSYGYIHPSRYYDFFYKHSADYKLNHRTGDYSYSNVIHEAYDVNLSNLIKAVKTNTDNLYDTLKLTVAAKDQISALQEEIIKLLEQSKYQIDIYGQKDNIVKDINECLRQVYEVHETRVSANVNTPSRNLKNEFVIK